MSNNKNTAPLLSNLMSALVLIFYVIAIIIMPIMIFISYKQYRQAINPKERKFRLLATLELFCYCYAFYGFGVILVLHNVFNEWAIWSFYPSVWGTLAGFPREEMMLGALADAFCCAGLAPLFGFWASFYGHLVGDYFFEK